MNKERVKLIKLCEICKSNATCLCFKCNSYFCEKCYKIIHQIKKDPEHKKESIDPFVPIDLKCPDHPQDRMSLFCIDEKGKLKLIIFLNRNLLFILLL